MPFRIAIPTLLRSTDGSTEVLQALTNSRVMTNFRTFWEKIVQKNGEDRKTKETYKGFTFFRDNPDISVHEVVQMIFEICEVK